MSTDREMNVSKHVSVCNARREKSQKARKSERTETTPEESTGQWRLALINDWTKTWFVGT